MVTMEGLLPVADSLIAGSPWLGHQRKWSVNAFCPMFFKVFLGLALEVKNVESSISFINV